MRVICHDSRNITTSTRVTLMRLETTDDSVSVNACWAPMTSLLSRLISAPVWVRVKKAIGIFWMCSKTFARMSKMSPSPTLADTQRMPMERAVSTTARRAATRASPMIRDLSWWGMPLSMIDRKSSGLTRPTTASTTTSTRNQMRMVR